ncbi:MAG: pyridoxal phosphate-dependent aminotransferase [Proteobacteria bacterium]|nr:pyridoxal phosphate-dependent aminotransferase [Pseudomonadota bacterium]
MESQTLKFSTRSHSLKQPAIRSASVRCNAIGGINLGQGVCDIPAQNTIKQAATDAIFANKNLYAAHEGLLPLRQALSKKIREFNLVECDPESEILVSHGSTGAFVSAAKTLFNPGDEVILFEPFYGYHKHILDLLNINVVPVKTDLEKFTIDFAQLKNSLTEKTRGIVICSPCNPSGKVFTRDELTQIGELANKHNLFIITDEIYEYITYPGYEHISIASINDYWKRTVSISGFSKTYNVTGWRLGYAYAPKEIIKKMALVHDLIYVCPPTPLQHAMVAALNLDASFYDDMRVSFLKKRDFMVSSLRELGFTLSEPQGSYYLMADIRQLGFENDEAAALALLENAKVATVPGGSFYYNHKDGEHLLRVCFALDERKLQAAVDSLRKFLG